MTATANYALQPTGPGVAELRVGRSASLNAASQTMADIAKSARGGPSGFMWLTPRATV